jgi:regulator of RNase E activity RraA
MTFRSGAAVPHRSPPPFLDIGGSFNVGIACGGGVVHPGDVVVCDASGVLIMPPDEAEADIDWTLGKQKAEPASHEQLKRGEKLGTHTGASAMVEAKLGG